MKMQEDIRPVSYLKSRAADLLQQLNETHRPVIITQNGEPRAIIQDPESFERMRTAIGLMKLLAQGEKDVRLGKLYEHEKVFREVSKSLRLQKTTGGKKAKI